MVHNGLSLQDWQFAMLKVLYMPGEIIKTTCSLQLPLTDIVSVLCICGNQSTLYQVIYAKGANPNQFMTNSYHYPETSNLFVAYMEIQVCRNLKSTIIIIIIIIYWWYNSKRTNAHLKTNSNNAVFFMLLPFSKWMGGGYIVSPLSVLISHT